MQRWRSVINPGDQVEVEIIGVGPTYTIVTSIDTDGSVYVEVRDIINDEVIDENNLVID